MKTKLTSIILALALILAISSFTNESRAQSLQPTLLSWHNGEVQNMHHQTSFRHVSANLLNQFEFKLEKWMTDLASWDLLPTPRIEENAPALSDPSEVEEWMTEPADWNTTPDIETEAEPLFEEWMSMPFVDIQPEADDNVLENWMLNTSDWASAK